MKYIPMLLLAISFSACATVAASAPETGGAHHASHDEPRPYDKTADARADVNRTLNAARSNGKMALVVMGANWCHDSRGLAAQFEKERMQTLIKDHYELVYVDVGQKNRNIDIAQDFGVDSIVGTPTVFIVSSDGAVLNLDTAPSWRNAASRSSDDIYYYFRDYAHPPKE